MLHSPSLGDLLPHWAALLLGSLSDIAAVVLFFVCSRSRRSVCSVFVFVVWIDIIHFLLLLFTSLGSEGVGWQPWMYPGGFICF